MKEKEREKIGVGVSWGNERERGENGGEMEV